MTTKALIIPAAGAGSRMQKEFPKPYIKLSGKTILEHTVSRFLAVRGLQQVIVATSPDYLDTARNVLDKVVPPAISAECVAGGAERQDSIRNALEQVGHIDLVMVHDAVRPFVNPDHIRTCCRAASEEGGAVLGVPAKDTIKRIDERRYIRETPSRKYLWQTQTPQVFRREIIMEAYKRASQENFKGTDDSSLVERTGRQVKMVEGDRTNFKITYPLDLELAKLLISKEQG